MGQLGLNNIPIETKTSIKIIINCLMDSTIESANILFLTLANTSTIRITDKFKPTAIFIDKAAQAMEIETLLILVI